MRVLRKGGKGEAIRQLQAATNRRLRARDLDEYVCGEDGDLGAFTLRAVRKAAWALGALATTFEAITTKGQVPVGVQRIILSPGTRNAEQLARARARISQMRAERQAREKKAASEPRLRLVKLALLAKANYYANPGSYHYLAGGKANLVFLKPTPRDWRSDCSQFVASVYAEAGLPSPASVPHQWASTYSIAPHGKLTRSPKPGDLGLYGPRGNTHHVEMYCGAPGAEFVGHGSPPIDSLTPGRPDFFVTYNFLD